MQVEPAEKAVLEIKLAAARYLDPDCYMADDLAGRALIHAARGVLRSGADSAAYRVQSDAAIGGYLEGVANELAGLLSPNASAGTPEVQAAEALLRDRASSCCSVLPLAAQIEERVRTLIARDANLQCAKTPAIVYVVAPTNMEEEVAPFRLNGCANIRLSPRTVTLIIMANEITCRDLWHLAYTLHHELVCHAFQGALATRRLKNAHQTCHWTEGWVDTLAYDLTRDWLDRDEAPKDWLPLRGEDAQGELRAFYENRYVAPRGLERSDINRRRRARDAYRRLPKALSGYRLAAPGEAEDIVRRFTLAANTHPDADCDRLKRIGSKLRIALLSAARPEAAPNAAAACLAFAEHHNLSRLEAELDAIQ